MLENFQRLIRQLSVMFRLSEIMNSCRPVRSVFLQFYCSLAVLVSSDIIYATQSGKAPPEVLQLCQNRKHDRSPDFSVALLLTCE